MKRFILPALLLAQLSSYAQGSYTIKGKVGHLNKPAKAYLYYKIRGTNQSFVDSTFLTDGNFTFKGKVDSPKEANIRLVHDNTPNDPTKRPKFDVLALFVEDTEITLTAKDSIKHATIKGSKLNDENTKVNAMLKPHYDKYTILNDEYNKQPEEKKSDKTYIQSLEDRATAIQNEIIDVKMKYVRSHPDQFMALMAFNSTLPPEFDARKAEEDFLKLSAAVRNSDLGKDVAEKIQKVKKTQEGSLAPDFTLNDVAGKPVKLSDYKGQYVLLDFWASWCAPCRRENPNLIKAYHQFKDKGFTILGVSLDKPEGKEKWLKAIKDDGLTWTQVSDLKGWDSPAAQLYEVEAIPMNFLIDKEGKIIAKYLRGEALNTKLAELLGQ
ncbi:TlpA disulfide reductase family protein [Siphonobacter sp. SORGH_AS_1065]|uniref:TlpA disulfide reductase family protein n=1 Tax=Siphonobacter sp. SORGH_AS_1065 TaxID=3041795 RepID=UPI0027810A57|nr:TlpA disulfide reductase family protein [Siphonobacter sp. SORGH_AS_1065]MDQ1090142.1 peroxiredoxin [Siphonobacter sp. SORGH_AS_1065]